MKKIVSFITVFALLFMACEGPQGPPGLEGLPGRDAVDYASLTFDRTVSFTAPNYEAVFDFPFEVFEGEVALVYIEWENQNGESFWRLLPQTEYFSDGTELMYNYDFTLIDVGVFLDGTTDFGLLDPTYTINQKLRVVLIPTIMSSIVDVNDYQAVINELNN